MSSLVHYNRRNPALYNMDEFLTPFSSLFNDIYNSLSDGSEWLNLKLLDKTSYPRVDIVEEDDKIIITAEIPGLTKDQISVELVDGILRIKGEKREESEDKSKKYIYRELKHSSFCRSFVVGDHIDKETIGASFENGVLKVTLKKTVPTPKVEPKKIEVK
jgi:HSP20 family protein